MDFRRLLSTPHFKNEEKTRIAGLIHWIMILLIGLIVLDTVLLAIFAPETSSTFWMNYLGIGICLVCLLMGHAGWVRISSFSFIFIFWLLMIYYFSYSGGINSPGFGFISLLIILGGMLLGLRGAISFGLLSIGTAIGLFVAGQSGLLINLEAPPTPSRLFASHTAILATIAVFMGMSSRSVYLALKRSRDSEKALAQQNKQLREEINKRQILQQEQQRLLAILDVTPDFVGIANMDGTAHYVNPAGRAMLEMSEDIEINQTSLDYYHPPEIIKKLQTEAIPHASKHGVWSGEMRLLKQNGEEIPVSQVIVAHRDTNDKVEFFSTIMHDITMLRAAEEDRLKLAIQDERLKSFKEFLSHISHDLRTPMTVIRTSTHLLGRYTDEEKRQEKIETIQRQLTFLDNYIQELLDLTRLDHLREFKFQQIVMNDLLQDVSKSLSDVAGEKNIVLKLGLPEQHITINADTYELERAIRNLIENAIHYTPEGGCVTITSNSDDTSTTLEIADTGIGISDQDQKTIFERFYRSEKARHLRPDGTGLGLAIVKRIIEGHNGTIAVESQLGVGTTFHIILPLALSETEVSHQQA